MEMLPGHNRHSPWDSVGCVYRFCEFSSGSFLDSVRILQGLSRLSGRILLKFSIMVQDLHGDVATPDRILLDSSEILWLHCKFPQGF